MYRKTKVILDWSIAIAAYLATLLAIPLGNLIFGYLGETQVDGIFNIAVNIIVALVFLSLFIIIISKGEEVRFSSYAWLVVICVLSIYFLINIQVSRDRLHFLGYGVLSLLLYRALRHSIATYMLYLWVLLAVVLFAFLDELLQLSGAGGRSFSFTDIRIDCFSALLGQLLIALVIAPKLELAQTKLSRYLKEFSRLDRFRRQLGRK